MDDLYRCESIPLSLCTGWTVLENHVVISKNAIKEQKILKLEYVHKERKKVFSYQDYTALIAVDLTCDNNDSRKYSIKLFVIPCDQKCYCLEEQFCDTLIDVMKKVELMACQYSTPDGWSPEQIQWINEIWLETKEKRNFKKIRIYNGTSALITPIKLMPIKIPKGWTIVINSFYKDYSFKAVASLKQAESELRWERDIAIFVNKKPGYSIYVDLEDFTNANCTSSAIHIHAYKVELEGSVQWAETELESIFCLEVSQAVLKLEYMLCKYSSCKEW